VVAHRGDVDSRSIFPTPAARRVECKLPPAELDPAQAEWGEIYRRCGLERIVATSVQQFQEELNEIRARRNRERKAKEAVHA
jgi:hypothetical protein